MEVFNTSPDMESISSNVENGCLPLPRNPAIWRKSALMDGREIDLAIGQLSNAIKAAIQTPAKVLPLAAHISSLAQLHVALQNLGQEYDLRGRQDLKELTEYVGNVAKTCQEQELNSMLAESPEKAAILAIENNSAKNLTLVLEKTPNLISQPVDDEANTLLHISEKFGNAQLSQLLLDKGESKVQSFDNVNRIFQLPTDMRSDRGKGLQVEQFMPKDIQSEDPKLQAAFHEIVMCPSKGLLSLRDKGSGSLEGVLSHLCKDPDWVADHPNLVTVILCHAVKHLFPSTKVTPYLNELQSVMMTPERSANILHAAIATGRLDIVENLIDLKVDISATYTPPLTSQESIGTTPLEQAISQGRLEIAELLISRGCPFDISVTSKILESLNQKTSNRVAKWILSRIPDQASMQFRLDLAIEKHQWGEVSHWINQGAIPSKPEQLALDAVFGKQFYLVEELWDKGLLPGVSTELLRSIVLHGEESWVIDFFMQLKEKGIHVENKNVIFDAARGNMIPLAALLVSLGGDCKGLPNEQEISHYASHLTGSIEEQVFRCQLTDKNLAHLVGDSFIKEMENEGKRLEGNTEIASGKLFASALNYVSKSGRHNLENVSKTLEGSRKFTQRLNGIKYLQNQQEIADALIDLEKDLLKEVDQLAAGGSLLLPMGWFGHATALVCKKIDDQTLEFQMINTGVGIDHHSTGHDSIRRRVNTINYYQIRLDKLQDSHLLQAVLEPIAMGHPQHAVRYGSADVYSALAPYKRTEGVISDDLFKGWKTSQLAGTCSLRCLLVYLKSEVSPDVYQELVDALKEDAISFAIEQNEPFLEAQPALRKLLAIAVPHLFDTFGKRLKQAKETPEKDALLDHNQRLVKLESVATKLKEAIPPAQSVHHPLSNDAVFPTQADLISSKVDSLPPLEDISSTKEVLSSSSIFKPAPLPQFTLDSIATPQELVDRLDQCLQFGRDMDQQFITSAYFSNLLCTIGRGMLNETIDGSDSFSLLLETLQKDPQSCEEVIRRISQMTTELQRIYSQSSEVADPSRFLAMNFSLATAYKLCTYIDKSEGLSDELSIGYYGVYFDNSKLEYDLLSQTILNSEWESDYKLLATSQWSKGFKDAPPLFNFDEHNYVNPLMRYLNEWSFRLDPKGGEYKYAEAHSRDIEDWNDAENERNDILDEAFDKIQKGGGDVEPYCDSPQWNPQWLYAKNRLPSHFTLLRDLAATAFHFRAGYQSPSNEIIDRYQPGKMFLVEDDTIDRETKTSDERNGFLRVIPTYSSINVQSKPLGAINPLPDIPGIGNHQLSLEVAAQNKVIEEGKDIVSRELMSMRSAFLGAQLDPPIITGIANYQLVDYYLKNLDQLTDRAHQVFFEATLFTPRHLSALLKEDEGLVSELNEFFSAASQHFDDRLKMNVDKNRNAFASVFVANQSVRFLSYCKTNHRDIIGEIPIERLMEDVRYKLSSMLASSDYKDEQVKHYLNLAFLDSFQAMPIKNLEETHQVLKCLADLKIEELMGKNTPAMAQAFMISALSIPVQQAENIHRLLKEQSDENVNSLLNTVAAKYGLSGSDNGLWQIEHFPICFSEARDGSVIELNCLAGDIRRNGQPIIGVPQWVKSSDLYAQVFGEKMLCANQSYLPNGAILLEAQDQHGRMEILSKDGRSITQIRRQIQGSWYSYVDQKQGNLHPPVPPFKGDKELAIWRSADDPNEYLFVDPATNQPKIGLDRLGHYILFDINPNKRFDWVDLKEVSGGSAILALDSDAFIYQEVSDKKPIEVCLRLPHLLNAAGGPLEFVRAVPVQPNKEDPSQGVILPNQDRERWVLKGAPHLFLSDDQRITGIRVFDHFLVLESVSGNREGIVPMKSLTQVRNKKSVETTYARIKLTNDHLTSTSPDKNAYLAYLTLTHATTAEEYLQAMHYLESAKKFERYTPDELRLLGSILLSNHETKDHTGYAFACRLYVAWLVQDNLQRNPQYSVASKQSTGEAPTFLSHTDVWESFWNGDYSFQIGKNTRTLDDILDYVAEGYFARAQHIPFDMRIENIISGGELCEWGLENRAAEVVIRGPKPVSAASFSPPKDLDSLFVKIGTEASTSSSLLTRPSEDFIGNFKLLWDAALSNDPARKESVNYAISYISQDPNSDVRFLATILHAALNKEASEEAQNLVSLALPIMSSVHPNKNKYVPDLASAVMRYAESIKPDIAVPHQMLPPLKSVTLLPKHQPIRLPEEIPNTPRVPFSAPPNDIESFHNLFSSSFDAVPDKNSAIGITPFEFKTNDPWLHATIEELNSELALGEEKNRAVPTYQLKEEYPAKVLLANNHESIVQEADALKKHLGNLETEILEMANRLSADPLDALIERTALSSGRQQPLAIQDCIALFLLGDPDAYQRDTNLKNPEDIAGLHQKIGEYIISHNQLQRYDSVVKILDKLSLNSEDPGLLQQLGEELSRSPAYHDADPVAFMVFEYSLNLMLRDHQVAGIRDMMEIDPSNRLRLKSKLLQRIQGGGKSLVFGHIMALLKADGYHLSVHIPPTAQYQTALYDMAQRSEKIFGQRERNITFDDHPSLFTPKYLQSLNNMLHEAIVCREYVTVTNESLRAMRCKYLKTLFQIRELPEGAEKNELMASNALLKDILGLLRSRGVFTVDEVHLALDPTKELNMPYGQVSHPEVLECQFIAQILQEACDAKDENGELLLDIKNASQQSEQKRIEMIAQVVQGLRERPGWDDDAIIDYIKGSTELLPDAFHHPDHRTEAKLIILARQMISGKWLDERLRTKVDEDHGLEENSFPRISIPFLANMKPAKGSEFSDPTIMTINTLIAYLAKGLTEDQTKEFLLRCRQTATEEKDASEETNPLPSIQQTRMAEQFARAYGINLFDLDPDNSKDVAKLHQNLLNSNKDSVALLLDFVVHAQISAVELYPQQVCSNGQNTISMAQSAVGYSGSMENLNMAPIGVKILPEKGTNGQTIHRLISQQTEVTLVGSAPDDLFSDLIDKHPRRNDVRAIIDTAAHFRGMKNEAVASLICSKMQDYQSQVQGVLFFHTETDRLCFMHRDAPNDYTILSGSTPETIASETGLKPEQLFTYYDQDHTTGIDITQADKAIAVLTIKEDTQEHEVLQGARRMRGLDKDQRIVVALAKGATEKVNATIGRLKGSDSPPNIKEMLLFTRLQEAAGQKPNNLLFALQKIENEVQQLVLDRLYVLPQKEEQALFSKASYLFGKDVSKDLYREYANQRQNVPIKKFLDDFVSSLTDPLKGEFSDEELLQLRNKILDNIVNETVLNGLEKEISISGEASLDDARGVGNLNGETTRMQHRQQEQRVEQVKVKLDEQKNQNEYQLQVESFRKYAPHAPYTEPKFDQSLFLSHEFGIPTSEINHQQFPRRDEQPVLWTLNNALSAEINKLPITFDDGLIVTSNAAIEGRGRTDLVGPWRKRSSPVLLIQDRGGAWKGIICSEVDSVLFEHWMKQKDTVLPAGRTMRLVRSNGKPLASLGGDDVDPLKDPQASKLMLQALLFAGDYKTLSRAPWTVPLEAWFNTLTPGKMNDWKEFFEKQILIGQPPGYTNSKLYHLFQSRNQP